MKTGLLGGTFNPIHNAHIQLAKKAYDFAGLDEVCFIPSGCSYLKDASEILPGDIRRKMVELAISEYPYFSISDVELNRPGNSYTCDTLMELHDAFPKKEFFLIMGADNLFELEKWKSPDIIMQYAHILAAVRGEKNRQDMMDKISELTGKFRAKITLLPIHHMEISSTVIRNRLKKGEPVDDFLPSKVEEYIKRKGIYSCQKRIS